MEPRHDPADADGAPPVADAPSASDRVDAAAAPPASEEPALTAGPPVLSDAALASRVAAWHNRHPLAQRITPAMVQGMGIVAVPVLAGGQAGRGPRPASRENFIAPVTPQQAASFAARHGMHERPDVAPLREVVADEGGASQVLYLRTAAIEAFGQRVRVLVAPRTGGRLGPAVLGPRLWSLQRTLVASALGGASASAMVALIAAAVWWPRADVDAPMLAAAEVAASSPLAESAAVAASAPEVLSAASAPEAQVTAEPIPAAASAASAAAEAVVVAAPAKAASGAIVEGDDPGGPPSDIRPRLTEEQRAEARRIGRLMRGETEVVASPPDAPASAASAAAGRHYALVTRITRGRAASQVMQSLMASAAAGAAMPAEARTEVLQVKEGWRAIWWPFTSQQDAGRASAALAAYGIEAELVEF